MTLRKRLMFALDSAIVVGALLVIVSPSSPLTGYFREFNQRRADRNRTEAVWDQLISSSPEVGDIDSENVLVEFLDYECPACRMSPAILDSLREHAGGLRILVRHLPLESLHPAAKEAALASICADSFKVFPAYHEALLTGERWQSDRDWAGIALSVGVADTAAFKACTRSGAAATRLESDRELASALQIGSLPTFVGRRRIIRGLLDFDRMKDLLK